MRDLRINISEGVRTIARNHFSLVLSEGNWDLVRGLLSLPGCSEKIVDGEGRNWLVSNRGSDLSFRCGILRAVVPHAMLKPACEVVSGDTDTHWACGCADCVFLQASEAM